MQIEAAMLAKVVSLFSTVLCLHSAEALEQQSSAHSPRFHYST
jgi:hypothetical protein